MRGILVVCLIALVAVAVADPTQQQQQAPTTAPGAPKTVSGDKYNGRKGGYTASKNSIKRKMWGSQGGNEAAKNRLKERRDKIKSEIAALRKKCGPAAEKVPKAPKPDKPQAEKPGAPGAAPQQSSQQAPKAPPEGDKTVNQYNGAKGGHVAAKNHLNHQKDGSKGGNTAAKNALKDRINGLEKEKKALEAACAGKKF